MRFELKEDVDKLIKIVSTRKMVTVDELSEELNWTQERVKKLAWVAARASKDPKLMMVVAEGRVEVCTTEYNEQAIRNGGR